MNGTERRGKVQERSYGDERSPINKPKLKRNWKKEPA